MLDRLLVFSKKLTKLTVREMHETSEHNRKELVYMCEKILNLRPPLTHLDFYMLFTSEESAQKGEPLLQAIASIYRPILLYLDLGANELLWKDDKRFNMLLDVLQQQYNLEHLRLNLSRFSAVQTE